MQSEYQAGDEGKGEKTNFRSKSSASLTSRMSNKGSTRLGKNPTVGVDRVFCRSSKSSSTWDQWSQRSRAWPAFDALWKGAVRREFDVVMVWVVDRLGRSLSHLVNFLSEIHAKKVDLFIHQQGIDTTTPAGKALFGVMGVFAEFEGSMIQERVRSGINVYGPRRELCGDSCERVKAKLKAA